MPLTLPEVWNSPKRRAAAARWLPGLCWMERTLLIVGLVLVTLEIGGESLGAGLSSWLESICAAGLLLSAGRWVAECWTSEVRREFLARRGWLGILLIVWGLFRVLTPALGAAGPTVAGPTSLTTVTELAVLMSAAGRLVGWLRAISSRGADPAATVAASFVLLIGAGAGLLMLPACRVQSTAGERSGAPPLVAVFTATSAACVTGLVVVDTPTYWSRPGQVVILVLIQLGGLGIMTFGALFAVFAPQAMAMREHAFLGAMLEARRLSEVRQLLVAVLAMTLLWELGGAALLWNLWPDLPVGERAFQCLFHSVSAFCNAGFSLRPNNLVGWGERWQVCVVVSGLIIAGGLGFATLGNIAGRLAGVCRRLAGRDNRSGDWTRRMTLGTRLAVGITVALLLAGTLAVAWLEGNGQLRERSLYGRLAEAWFQSVSFRTAGFNAIDQATLHPATKFFGIVLMFIGGCPGSTAGGVKTLPLAVLLLAVWALLRGRERVEVGSRTICDEQVKRAGTVVVLGMGVVVATTFLLVVIENRPELFLDHLFEATSAFGTVGLSSVDSMKLAPLSKAVLVATMFLGRVGPLTLLVALSSRRSPPAYEYPVERVMLG